MNLEKSIQSYLDELSSSAPTPGGGNVAAFSAVMACSLGTMVCNLTIGKKKYADVQQEMMSVKEKFIESQKIFEELALKDNAAFDKVMEAFKLPKDTEEEKNHRNEQIESATLEAGIVPSEVLKNCRNILPYLKVVSEKGNQNSLSDAGVALSLTSTAAQGAFLNVLINCSSLSNQTVAQELLKGSEIVLDEVKAEIEALINSITKKLTKVE